MENNQKEQFTYTYSAKQQEEIKTIRKKYVAPETDKMEQLRQLDRSVTQKAEVISLCVGIIGALIMGAGMSLVMTDIGSSLALGEKLTMIVGICIGIVGMVMAGFAYPLYMRVLKNERERIAPEIIRLADELLK